MLSIEIDAKGKRSKQIYQTSFLQLGPVLCVRMPLELSELMGTATFKNRRRSQIDDSCEYSLQFGIKLICYRHVGQHVDVIMGAPLPTKTVESRETELSVDACSLCLPESARHGPGNVKYRACLLHFCVDS